MSIQKLHLNYSQTKKQFVDINARIQPIRGSNMTLPLGWTKVLINRYPAYVLTNMPTTGLFEVPQTNRVSPSSNVSSVLPKTILLMLALTKLFVRRCKTLFVPQGPTTKSRNCAVISMPTNAPTVIENLPTPVSDPRETIQPYFVQTL